MCRGVWQLVGAAIALVHFLHVVGLIVGAVGRSAVVECSAGSGDIHLACHDVGPDGVEVLLQLFFAALQIEVCHTGIQIVCPHRMTHGIILLAEGHAVLIVVGAVFHLTSYVDEFL